jgi:hypothetical protein
MVRSYAASGLVHLVLIPAIGAAAVIEGWTRRRRARANETVRTIRCVTLASR